MREIGIQAGRLLLAVFCVVCFAAPAKADWDAQNDVTVPAGAGAYTDGNYVYSTRNYGYWKLGTYCNLAYAKVNVWSRTAGHYVAAQNEPKQVQTSWKKSYASDECEPDDTSFITSGTLTLGWWLDGDANDGTLSKAWALTHSQANFTINSYPGTDGDMSFSGDWSIQKREGDAINVALNISWPPGFTIGYTPGNDTWVCGADTKDRPFEMDFSSDGHTTVYTKVIQFAKARSAYNTSAYHAYTMGKAFLSQDFALVEGP